MRGITWSDENLSAVFHSWSFGIVTFKKLYKLQQKVLKDSFPTFLPSNHCRDRALDTNRAYW